MSKQTQGTMLLVGAMAGAVGLVAFVALMVMGDYNFSPALFLALVVASVAAVVLVRGFHRKPSDADMPKGNAPAKNAKAPAGSATSRPAPASAPSSAPAMGASHTAEMHHEHVDRTPAPVAAPAHVAPEPTVELNAPTHRNDAGRRPEALSAPRDGGADDLKKIKGVGPKLEELCNSLGFYHFDQIANWSDEEVAWVDENLEGFKGRVSRDEWVGQAKQLASGEETEFSRQVDGDNVY